MSIPRTTFSQSSLQDYQDCPRRFQLRYLDHLAWPAMETEPMLENERRQQEGQLFHRLAQQALIGLPLEKLGKLAASPNLSRWWDYFTNALQFGDLKALLGQKLLSESTLSAPVGEHRIMAKYDLLAIGEGKVTIIDWKTYHKRTKNEYLQARWQTRIYQYLLVEAGAHLNGGQPFAPEQVEMRYWFTEFPTDPAIFPYNTSLHQRNRAGLEKIISEIDAASQFPATEEKRTCLFCNYRSYCDRGTHAGDWREGEDSEPLDITLEQVGEIEL